MAQMVVVERKCTGCGLCASQCPFGAIDMSGGKPVLNAACKVCGICIKTCPEKAFLRLETKVDSVDKTKWRDILVFVEACNGRLHPVGLELIGKAQELAAPLGYQVNAVLVGHDILALSQELRHYGVRQTAVYDDPELRYYRADAYAACVEDYIRHTKPSVVLVGATALGRSLAPRLSTRFHTGLTADCTSLALRPNSDLVQIRPAFGGNIMAQIITPHTRPQFATVRYRVMDAPLRSPAPTGQVLRRSLPPFQSPVSLLHAMPTPPTTSISDAEVLVVGGRGLGKSAGLDMVKEAAALLHGDWAVTRPLVEQGWAGNERQIGLSGRTVRPRLIITCGVSGAIQFTSSMNQSEHIVAIDTCPTAPIFGTAHIGIVGDVYQVLPDLIHQLKEVVQ